MTLFYPLKLYLKFAIVDSPQLFSSEGRLNLVISGFHAFPHPTYWTASLISSLSIMPFFFFNVSSCSGSKCILGRFLKTGYSFLFDWCVLGTQTFGWCWDEPKKSSDRRLHSHWTRKQWPLGGWLWPQWPLAALSQKHLTLSGALG